MLKIKHIKKVLVFILVFLTAYSLSISSLLIDANQNTPHNNPNQITSAFITVKKYDARLENIFKFWIFDTKGKIDNFLP